MLKCNNSNEINYHSSYDKSIYLFKNFSATFRVQLHPFSSNHIFYEFTKNYTFSKVKTPWQKKKTKKKQLIIMDIIQPYCQINGYPMAKKTSSINYWKENLNTCFSFSWKIVPSNQDKTSRTLGCCKIQIVFKNQRNLWNVFRFKDRWPYDLVPCVGYKFQ